MEGTHFAPRWVQAFTFPPGNVGVSRVIAHLQVELRREGSIFHVADVVLGEVQVGEVSEAAEGGVMHRPYLVLVQPQVHDSAVERRSRVKIQLRVVGGYTLRSPVDVGGDGFIRRLVHAADGQPHEAFLALDKPAVGCYRGQPHD